MSFKRKCFDFKVSIEKIFGLIINYPQLKIWRVNLGKKIEVRGLLRITNYGSITIGNKVIINSSLSSSELGFYPKTILHTSQTGKIIIEEGTGISNTCINSRCLIKIGKNVRIGAGVKLYDNDFHDLSNLRDDNNDSLIPAEPIIIEDNVFIGAGSIILKGVKIGKGAIIGAGSLVTKEIGDNEMWAGNPARCIKKITRKD